MAFAGVIFDVDGVLVDSPHERAWRDTLEELMSGSWRYIRPLSRYAPELFDTRLYQELVAGKPRHAGARAVLEYFGVPEAGRLSGEYAGQKQNMIVRLIAAGAFKAFPDALRFVQAVRATKMPMAVASSSQNANELLSRVVMPEVQPWGNHAEKQPGATLLSVFDANVCGLPIPQGKPHPDIFLAAARELGVAPAGVVVIEDAPSGVQAAKAGEMAAIGVARLDDEAMLRAAGADMVVRSLDEVDVVALSRGDLVRRRVAA